MIPDTSWCIVSFLMVLQMFKPLKSSCAQYFHILFISWVMNMLIIIFSDTSTLLQVQVSFIWLCEGKNLFRYLFSSVKGLQMSLAQKQVIKFMPSLCPKLLISIIERILNSRQVQELAFQHWLILYTGGCIKNPH